MSSEPNFEEEYQSRFGWRRERQIFNLAELHTIAHWGGPDTTKQLRKLWGFSPDDPLYVLQHSILTLWNEAVECYIFGLFQSCILTCGAVVERSLKYEYQKLKGTGLKGYWTLGKCIHELNGVLESEIIELAEEILGPRNSRAHALLEHSDPFLAYMGSKRGKQQVNENAYILEYYRGDAKEVISKTFTILNKLYGVEHKIQDE